MLSSSTTDYTTLDGEAICCTPRKAVQVRGNLRRHRWHVAARVGIGEQKLSSDHQRQQKPHDF